MQLSGQGNEQWLVALAKDFVARAKLWGMKGNSRKGWGRDPIPGSAGAPFPFQHLIPPAPQVTGRSAYKAYVSSYT